MLMNRRAKFDAASFILAREIRNHTNTQKNKKTNTVTDVSPFCLSACVDNNTSSDSSYTLFMLLSS